MVGASPTTVGVTRARGSQTVWPACCEGQGSASRGRGHVVQDQLQRGLMFGFFTVLLGWVTLPFCGAEPAAIGRVAGESFLDGVSVLDAYKLVRLPPQIHPRATHADNPAALDHQPTNTGSDRDASAPIQKNVVLSAIRKTAAAHLVSWANAEKFETRVRGELLAPVLTVNKPVTWNSFRQPKRWRSV